MHYRRGLIHNPVTQIYLRYLITFLIFWLVIAIIDWHIYKETFNFNFGDLSEILNFSSSIALILTGVIAATLMVFKRVSYGLVWIVMALMHFYFLSQATSIALGAGGYFYLAAHEWLLYLGPSEKWKGLVSELFFYSLLPLTIAYSFSIWRYWRSSTKQEPS